MIKTLIIRNISTIIGGIVGKNRFCNDELPSMLNFVYRVLQTPIVKKRNRLRKKAIINLGSIKKSSYLCRQKKYIFCLIY